MKNILVEFECQIGEHCHNSWYIFDKKKSDWGYCKEFWGITKKNTLEEGVFWDDYMMNTIKICSDQEITEEEKQTLKRLGVVYGG